MTRSELVARVTANTGLDGTAAGAAVDNLFEAICQALARGDKVRVGELGALSTRPRPLPPSRH